jgi:3-dehydroquinate synthase class II
MLIEAETEDGTRHSTLLQNAETVRLVCPSAGSIAPGSTNNSSSNSSASRTSSSSAELTSQTADITRSSLQQGWQAVSVSALQPGQKVFLLMQEGARHTGISIQEQIKEC